MAIEKTFFKRLLPYLTIFIVIETILRISLLFRALFDVELTSFNTIALLWHGLWFDIVTGSFFLLPFALYHVLLPTRQQGQKLDRILDAIFRFIFVFGLLFDAVAEHLFWIEFTTRFNFIAVDYLVYTQEVIGNVVESYPLFWLLLGVALGSAEITWISLRSIPLDVTDNSHVSIRTANFAVLLVVCGILNVTSNIEQAQFSDNAEANELAANGMIPVSTIFP